MISAAAHGAYGVLPLVAAIPLITTVVGAGAGIATPFAQKAAAQKGELDQMYKQLARLQKAYNAPFSFQSKTAIGQKIQALTSAIQAKEREIAAAERAAAAAEQQALLAGQRPNYAAPIAATVLGLGVIGAVAYVATRRKR